jgi:hypothetical protein
MSLKKSTAMEQEKIKALLDKFYEGNTSVEEEAQLREYLHDHSIAGTLSPEADYMSLYQCNVPEPSDNFRERLESVIHTATGNPVYGRILRYTLRIAAVAVLVTALYFLADYLRSGEMKDTYSDPHIAMAEVKNILTVVSNNMKAGTQPLGSIRTMNIAPEAISPIGKINSTLGKSLQNLRYLNNLNTNEKDIQNN